MSREGHLHSCLQPLMELLPKQESPPAWTQETCRPPRSKYSLCCSICGGGGVPPSRPDRGGVAPRQEWMGTQPSGTWQEYPPPQMWTDKLKTVPPPILRMRAVTTSKYSGGPSFGRFVGPPKKNEIKSKKSLTDKSPCLETTVTRQISSLSLMF